MKQEAKKDIEILPKNSILNYLLEEGFISHVDHELTIHQYSNGYSNLTYLLQVEGKEFVLRHPPKGATKRGHDMSREYKVLSNLQKSFDASPKTYSFCDDDSIIGVPFYLMEKVEGIIITNKEAHVRKIGPSDFKKISEEWMSMFVRLHNLDYEHIGLSDLGRPNGYVERQVSNWGKQYLKAATMDIPEAGKLMTWMQDHQPKEYSHSLIHNDYKYDNVVFKDDGWSEINAILDWEMCTLGDPLMDLGTSIAYWMMPSDGPIAQVLLSPTLLDGNPSRTELVHQYSLKSGRDINDIVFYYVYGLFKIAVIVQQIYYRYHSGLTQNKKFAHLDKACQAFCQMGWQAVQKNRIENYM